jgi:hypothetical protein
MIHMVAILSVRVQSWLVVGGLLYSSFHRHLGEEEDAVAKDDHDHWEKKPQVENGIGMDVVICIMDIILFRMVTSVARWRRMKQSGRRLTRNDGR